MFKPGHKKSRLSDEGRYSVARWWKETVPIAAPQVGLSGKRAGLGEEPPGGKSEKGEKSLPSFNMEIGAPGGE